MLFLLIVLLSAGAASAQWVSINLNNVRFAFRVSL